MDKELIIYLAGIIPAYIALKWSFKKAYGIWTIGDRAINILLSLFSWFGFIAAFIAFFIVKLGTNNKPAKW